ncbi:MAG: RnfABCDGE type electron transport complex subunit D [Acidobacteriota bacterium]
MRRKDPRPLQMLALGSLLVYGSFRLSFDLRPQVLLALATAALFTQALGSRLVGVPFEARSAAISTLSLCLLLRTHSVALAALVAALTIASKFVLRWRGKHVFNPTNFGLVAGLTLTGSGPWRAPAGWSLPGLWVSPGQWGSVAFFAFALACAGTAVAHRSRRSDVTWAFLGAWSLVLLGRAAWLGDPPAIPLHQLQSGGLLIFAFFMISDPKTTPDHRRGRVLFAGLTAAIAGFIQFSLYQPHAFLWALVLATPCVPLLDRLFPAERYRWGCSRSQPFEPTTQEVLHDAAPTPLPNTDAASLGPPLAPRPGSSLWAAAAAPGTTARFGLLRLLRRQGRYGPL